MSADRYSNKQKGKRFILALILFKAVLLIFWLVLHALWPPQNQVPEVDAYVSLSASGKLTISDFSTFERFADSRTRDVVLELAKEKNQEIENLINELELALAGVRGNYDKYRNFSKIQEASSKRDFAEAKAQLQIYRNQVKPEHRNSSELGSLLDARTFNVLDDLAELKEVQKNAKNQLVPPPLLVDLFWTDGKLAVLDMFLVALLGVTINLLVNSAIHLRSVEFRPIERWVAYTKLCYGPILAVFIVLLVVNGWIDFGDYQTTSYALPLVAFLLGYTSRRTVHLVDDLASRLLGQAEKSVAEGPSAIDAQYERAYRAKDSLRPSSMPALARDAKALGSMFVKAEVHKAESTI